MIGLGLVTMFFLASPSIFQLQDNQLLYELAILFPCLMLLVFFVTPTEERMITHKYEDVLASRPACAAIIDKNIGSASIECLREYKKYVYDSTRAADNYFTRLKTLKDDIRH
jgi:hypothetical protein